MRLRCSAITRMLCVAVFLGGSAAGAATGRVTAVAGDGTLTMSLGARDGVEVGMTGRIRESQTVGGKAMTLDVATFRVKSVTEQTSKADLVQVGQGWTVAAGMEVAFDRALTPKAAPAPKATPRSVRVPPTTAPPAAKSPLPAPDAAQGEVAVTLGARIGNRLDARTGGRIVEWVSPSSDAAASLRRDDVILSIDGADPSAWHANAGDVVNVVVSRAGERHTFALPVREAVPVFTADCSRGEAAGCTSLAEMLVSGDPARAGQHAAQGCEGGDPVGCLLEGQLRLEGRGLPKDVARGMALVGQSCDRGHGFGCVVLGETLLFGREGVVTDAPRAVRLLDRACQDGELAGCADLAVAYKGGLGVAQDGKRAVELSERACEGGVPAACSILAITLRETRGPGYDAARVARLAERGCDGGEPNGCLLLGSLHAVGEGVPADVDRAQQKMQRACDLGHAQACTIVTRLTEQLKPLDDARRGAFEAAALGDLRTMVSAQAAYQSANVGWYEGRLSCLGTPWDCIPRYPRSGPRFLDPELASGQVKLSYSRKLIAGPKPNRLPAGQASPSSATRYAYTVTPVPGAPQGSRSFCGDASGNICFRTDGREIVAPSAWCPVETGCVLLRP